MTKISVYIPFVVFITMLKQWDWNIKTNQAKYK